MNQDQLNNILDNHKKWLETRDSDAVEGCYADLHDANLHDAYLRDVDMRYANLHGTNLPDEAFEILDNIHERTGVSLSRIAAEMIRFAGDRVCILGDAEEMKS